VKLHWVTAGIGLIFSIGLKTKDSSLWTKGGGFAISEEEVMKSQGLEHKIHVSRIDLGFWGFQTLPPIVIGTSPLFGGQFIPLSFQEGEPKGSSRAFYGFLPC